MMQPQMGHSPSISDGSDYYPGMSDEEELRRIGQAHSGSQELGEVFAEIESDAELLGFRAE